MSEKHHRPPRQRSDRVPERGARDQADDVTSAEQRKSQGNPGDSRQQEQAEVPESVDAGDDPNRDEDRPGKADGNEERRAAGARGVLLVREARGNASAY
jgi:hypothetical protein